jgi:signal transduction histidine kinase
MSPTRKGHAYSIRRRVALLVGVGALAPTLLALWALHSAFDDVSRHLFEEHQLLARGLALHFDYEMRDHLASLSAATGTPEDWLTGNAQRSLRATFLRSPVLDAIVVVGKGPDGGKKVIWQELRHQDLTSATLLALPEVDAALGLGRQSVAHLIEPQRSRLVFLVPVRDWNGQVTNVVCAVANPAAPTWLAMLRQGALGSGSASIVDDKGRIVTSTGLTANAPAAGNDDITAAGALSVAPWQIVLRQVRDEALGPFAVQRGRILVLSPLLLVLALLFSWGATHSVTEPLKALNVAAGRIAGGNLDTAVPAQADDEVGQLGRSLEAMRVALKKSLDDLTASHDVLEQRVQARTQELRQLLTKIVSVQEDERRRIARELHDETCQTLAALGMKLDAALAAPTPDIVRERLTEARAFAGRTLADIHALIYELRPSVLDDLGLFPAIRWLAEHNLTPAGIAYRCEVSQPGRALSSERETTLFRAIQEAIRNVARHSEATQVLIQVEERKHDLQVEIEDDGHGFDPASVAVPGPSGRGLGLLGMRERLTMVGGTVEVISSADAGTRVILRVPFEEENHHG